jgi:hypothetical protein
VGAVGNGESDHSSGWKELRHKAVAELFSRIGPPAALSALLREVAVTAARSQEWRTLLDVCLELGLVV